MNRSHIRKSKITQDLTESFQHIENERLGIWALFVDRVDETCPFSSLIIDLFLPMIDHPDGWPISSDD